MTECDADKMGKEGAATRGRAKRAQEDNGVDWNPYGILAERGEEEEETTGYRGLEEAAESRALTFSRTVVARDEVKPPEDPKTWQRQDVYEWHRRYARYTAECANRGQEPKSQIHTLSWDNMGKLLFLMKTQAAHCERQKGAPSWKRAVQVAYECYSNDEISALQQYSRIDRAVTSDDIHAFIQYFVGELKVEEASIDPQAAVKKLGKLVVEVLQRALSMEIEPQDVLVCLEYEVQVEFKKAMGFSLERLHERILKDRDVRKVAHTELRASLEKGVPKAGQIVYDMIVKERRRVSFKTDDPKDSWFLKPQDLFEDLAAESSKYGGIIYAMRLNSAGGGAKPSSEAERGVRRVDKVEEKGTRVKTSGLTMVEGRLKTMPYAPCAVHKAEGTPCRGHFAYTLTGAYNCPLDYDKLTPAGRRIADEMLTKVKAKAGRADEGGAVAAAKPEGAKVAHKTVKRCQNADIPDEPMRYAASIVWTQADKEGKVCTGGVGDSGSDGTIISVPLNGIRGVVKRAKEVPVRYSYGGQVYMAYDEVQLNGAITVNATTCTLQGLWLDVPEDWPTEEVLIGLDTLRKMGLGDPLHSLVKLHQDRVIDMGGDVPVDVTEEVGDNLDRMRAPARARAYGKWVTRNEAFESVGLRATARLAATKLVVRVEEATDGGLLKEMLPETHGSENDELDEATGAPPLADCQSPGDDAAHAQAVRDLVERSIVNMRQANASRSREDQLDEAALGALSERVSRVIHSHSDAFRTAFYPTDKPCDVAAWVDPVRAEELRPRKRRAFRRHYAAEARRFMRAHCGDLLRAGLITEAGDIEDEHVAYAIANAVIAPKKGPERYRMAFDLRELNTCLEYYNVPTPSGSEVESVFAGKWVFLSFDLFKSFWQLPLSELSRRLYTLATAEKLYLPTRVIMGAKNSMSALSKAVREVLGDLMDTGDLAAYADDGAGGARSLEGMVDLLEKILSRCMARRLRINPNKMQIFETEMRFLGRVVRGGAIYPDPKMIDGLTALSRPRSVGDLMTFRGGVGWLSTHLPGLRAALQPLQELETALMDGAKRRTKAVASAIMIDRHWSEAHDSAFEEIKRLLREASENYLPTGADRLALFTDASRLAWSGVLLAFSQDQLHVAATLRDYRIVAWVGGCFTGAELSYGIPEKEVLAALRSTQALEMHLYGAEPFELHCDHKNMALCWALGRSTDADVSHVVAGRVQRWAAWFSRFHATVHHIKGEDNVAADYASRNREDLGLPTQAPRGEQEDNVQDGEERLVRRNQGDAMGIDDCRAGAIHHPAFEYPSLEEIGEEQDAALEGARNGHGGDVIVEHEGRYIINGRRAERHPTSGVWMVDTGKEEGKGKRIWIPAEHPSLRARITVVAHAAVSGHQGGAATQTEIAKRFVWTGMTEDIRGICRACLNCWATHRGTVLPRPFHPTLRPTKINQAVELDFFKVADAARTAGKAKRGRKVGMTFPHLLVIKDKLSRKVLLRPCAEATAVEACRGMLDWIGGNGIPTMIYSDNGPHFTATLVDELLEALQMDRFASIPYAAWTNGSVERTGGHVIDLAAALCSENKKPPEDWHEFAKVIENAVNSSPMSCLGGRSPLGVSSGTEPRRPLDVLIDGHGDEATVTRVKWSRDATAEIMDALIEELADVQEEAWSWSREQHDRQLERLNKGRGRRSAPVIQVGDYVMVRRRAAADSKLAPAWDGPHQVTGYVGDSAYKLSDILSGKERLEHASHVAKYCDSTVAMSKEVKRQAAHDRYGFQVQRIDGHKLEEDRYHVRMVWKGFEGEDDEYNQYEDMEYAMEVVPQLVKRYLRKLVKGSKASQQEGRQMLEALHLSEASVLAPALGDL